MSDRARRARRWILRGVLGLVAIAVAAVIGGGALIETSGELRFPIGEWKKLRFGGVGFLDGADVTAQPDQLFEKNLHWATGLGLRVKTIAGAIRLDVGYRLNRKGQDDPYPDDPFAFHLTIGEAF